MAKTISWQISTLIYNQRIAIAKSRAYGKQCKQCEKAKVKNFEKCFGKWCFPFLKSFNGKEKLEQCKVPGRLEVTHLLSSDVIQCKENPSNQGLRKEDYWVKIWNVNLQNCNQVEIFSNILGSEYEYCTLRCTYTSTKYCTHNLVYKHHNKFLSTHSLVLNKRVGQINV